MLISTNTRTYPKTVLGCYTDEKPKGDRPINTQVIVIPPKYTTGFPPLAVLGYC
jgi:hypothetical protein